MSPHFGLRPGDVVEQADDGIVLLTAYGRASTTLKIPTERWFGFDADCLPVEVELIKGKFQSRQCKSVQSNV
jgi:hypothetical protein